MFSSFEITKAQADKIDREIASKGTGVPSFNAIYLGKNEIEIG
jgi:hypothetical protein